MATRTIEDDAAISQRDVCVVADDQVIQHFDVEEQAGREGFGGEMQIIRRGCRIARRVVVDQDHA